MKAKYVGLMHVYGSERDRNGNCYWAFEYTDFASGDYVRATCTSERNYWQKNVMQVVTMMPVREFNRMTKGWSYAGCTGPDIATFVRAQGVDMPLHGAE